MKRTARRNILFFGNTTFGEAFQREHAFAIELSRRGFRVRYVNGIPSFFSMLQRIVRPKRGTISRTKFDGVDVVTPPMVPTTFRSSWTPRLDRMLFRRWFSKEFADWDWDSTLVCVMFPYWWNGFVRKADLGGAKILYDLCDSLRVPSRTDAALNTMEAAERLLIADCDVLTCSAFDLEKELNGILRGKRSTRITNGVWEEALKSTDGTSSQTDKSIVFVGTVDERWVDVQLITYLASALPDCTVRIVGYISSRHRSLFSKHRNILCEGPVEHQFVAGLMRTSSVGIIPFKKNVITDSVNPIKMYEYAAAGLSIVAIETDELQHYSKVVSLANDRDSFVAHVKKKLGANKAERSRLRTWARSNTWERKTTEFLKAAGIPELSERKK